MILVVEYKVNIDFLDLNEQHIKSLIFQDIMTLLFTENGFLPAVARNVQLS